MKPNHDFRRNTHPRMRILPDAAWTVLFYLLLAALLFGLFSCQKDEPEPELTLTGTRWSSFAYKSVVDGTNVYTMLYFKSATQVERYAATEKTGIIGTPDLLPYRFSPPSLTITMPDGKDYTGTVADNLIRVLDRDFVKE